MLRKKYGMTVLEYERIKRTQNGCCAVCLDLLVEGKAHVDHSHVTNKVRGILCPNCNQGLGNFRDDPQRLIQAIKYLLSFIDVDGIGLLNEQIDKTG